MAPGSPDWLSKTFREALVTLVRRRVAERDVEDLVQSVLAEAIASRHRPDDPTAVRRWIYGIVRNKIADHHRKASREVVGEPPEPAHAPPEAERALLDWALRELPEGMDARRTLDWLLRESDGEKLEEIAATENLSATQVRQRVSRLRRYFRERWAVHAAALAALGLVALFVWRRPRSVEVTPDRVVVGPATGVRPVDASVEREDAALDDVTDRDSARENAVDAGDRDAGARTRTRRSTTPSGLSRPRGSSLPLTSSVGSGS
jgi:RNA polymerase sigma factor (sigma-70 family)